MNKIKVGIVGGSGYGAGELLRILLGHPQAEIVGVASNSKPGQKVSDTHKNLRGFAEMPFVADTPKSLASKVDALFFALPHGKAKEIIPGVVKENPETKIIDLSGDFRLKNLAEYERYYGAPPEASLLSQFVYGLHEFNRDAIAGARHIANPGCFATAILFALMPLAKHGLLSGHVVVNAVTGSSGSGAEPKAGAHHPHREGNFWAYKALEHQHEPEILQALSTVTSSKFSFAFIPHSLPLIRGIFASVTVQFDKDTNRDDVERAFQECYSGKFFVRRNGESPELKSVAGTNFVDYSLRMNGRTLVVMTAIDNLVRGAAGQAVQNMNVMFGLDAKTGLQYPALYP